MCMFKKNQNISSLYCNEKKTKTQERANSFALSSQKLLYGIFLTQQKQSHIP